MTQETIDVLTDVLAKLVNFGVTIQKEIESDDDYYDTDYLLMELRGVAYAWNTILDRMPDDIREGIGSIDFYDMVHANMMAS